MPMKDFCILIKKLLIKLYQKGCLTLKMRCAFASYIGKKAFERVDWTKLLEMLRNVGVNWRERRLIRNLYMGQT